MTLKQTTVVPTPVRALFRKYGLISFALPFVVYFLTIKTNVPDAHFLTILTQYAMYTTGTPSLGLVSHPIIPNFCPNFCYDAIVSNGQYFSVYAPGMTFLSFPFGAIGFLLNGGKLTLDTWAIFTDGVFVALCAALASFALYKLCCLYVPPIPSLLASLTLAFGTLAWPFATKLFEHDVAMLFSLLGVYCVVRFSRRGNSTNSNLTLAAGAASLAVASTVEYLSALLIIPLILFLSYNRKLKVRSGLILGAFFILGPVLDLAYNRSVTGNPLIFPEDLFLGSNGSAALSRFQLSQLPAVTLYNLLSPYRGLLLLSPILFVGIYGLWRMYQSGRFRGEALLFLSLFLFGLLPYSAWSAWDGGNSFGPRFLIDVIPYLVIPIAFALSEIGAKHAKALKPTFLALFVPSSFIAGAAAFTSATPQVQTSLFYFQPIQQVIPWLLQNKIDAWWHALSPHLGALFVVSACFVLIWVSVGGLLFFLSEETLTWVPPDPGGKTTTGFSFLLSPLSSNKHKSSDWLLYG